MISRLSAFAATFAVLATASLAFAASVHQPQTSVSRAAAEPMPVVQLERVVITGKRVPQSTL